MVGFYPVTKHIFVTGGVASSLGKGLSAASLGRLLKSRGLKVQLQKLDPYINVDPGTMNPFQHGEVFVTEDGGETDLDLGHYERFVNINCNKNSNATTGSIYSEVIEKERRGEYLGQTVQVIPHITDEIKRRINALSSPDVDIVITEVGGTVGDIEILPFLEAIRQFRKDVGRNNVFYIHVTLIPFIGPSHELKTKPTQHSVTELRSRGIMPDAIICRSDRAISKHLKEKISSQCDVPLEGVVTAMDAKSLYDIPLVLHKEGLDNYVCELLNIEAKEPDLTQWLSLVDKVNNLPSKVTIGIVGKYINLPDAYLSVVESLKHGGYACGVDVKIKWIASGDDISTDLTDSFEDIDAVVIPGGFGFRGIEGKVQAIKFVRENNIPFLGICLGMQCAVIEYARSFCDLPDANSSEFNPETHSPVIDLMDEQIDVVDMGATMRLGSYKAKLAQGSLAQALYQSTEITERHRHRYEFNNKYREMLEDKGLIISGTSPDGKLVEFVELSKEDHPYFIATQAHPEFKSRPDEPHPLFAGLVSAAKNFAKNRDEYSKIDIREGALEFLKRVTQ